MCEKIGQGCACRLAVVAARLPKVQVIDISDSKLPILPPAIFELPELVSLDASGNAFTDLPLELAQAAKLKSLSLARNGAPLRFPDADWQEAVPSLRHLDLRGAAFADSAAMEAMCAALRKRGVELLVADS